jgi:hypothetical protein
MTLLSSFRMHHQQHFLLALVQVRLTRAPSSLTCTGSSLALSLVPCPVCVLCVYWRRRFTGQNHRCCHMKHLHAATLGHVCARLECRWEPQRRSGAIQAEMCHDVAVDQPDTRVFSLEALSPVQGIYDVDWVHRRVDRNGGRKFSFG